MLKGIFLKNIVYRDRGGGFTAAPLIIAKTLLKIVPPPAPETFWSRNGGYVVMGLIIVGVVGFVLFEYRRRVRAAVAAHPRRTTSEPMELVPDAEKRIEFEEEEEESEEQVQHVNPGPSKEAETEKKAEEDKKQETEPKNTEG